MNPALIRVDHLTDILRPEAFSDRKLPERVSDLRYRVDLTGLPVIGAPERACILDSLLGTVDDSGAGPP